ncbi:MAG: hypothetical protein GX428_03705 [Candidatus Atribacteria bacterium]|nr:hypothetical protein [Candidatus Atribacteria bacterium]
MGFSDWKKVDWPALYNQFKPRVKQAQKTNGFIVYYLTLRELILGLENPQNLPESMVEKKTLDGDIGYLKIWGLFNAD